MRRGQPDLLPSANSFLRCFAEHPIVIEHIGSTAVHGLAAKPIIDVLVLVDDLAFGHTAIPALEAGGYSFWRDNPDKAKLFLVKGLPPAGSGSV
jgi:GrpB-like predicted nucleotidyltransferase (UPF0157 family)